MSSSSKSIEYMEYVDWGITSEMTPKEQRSKSIEAYYLPNWIDKVRDLTFETVIYPVDQNLEGCPDILPFEQNIVRFEHKSPSDSEYWGPIRTKDQAIQLFQTSLRFLRGTKMGRYLCVRKYQPIGPEYRCFWNQRLVAVGSANVITETIAKYIIDYVNNIQDKIPFSRCVLDITLDILSDGSLGPNNYLIEFNSWETNSGASPFSWIDDTDILYPNSYSEIIFRWPTGSLKIIDDTKYTDGNDINSSQPLTNFDGLRICRPKKPANWLVTNKYIYITTDIWLGMFDKNLKPINWKRGVYRFDPIYLCTDGCIIAGGDHLDTFLKPLNKQHSTIDTSIFSNGDEYQEQPMCKYGFYCIDNNGSSHFIRMDNMGQFINASQ
jgi:hypothetical protein